MLKRPQIILSVILFMAFSIRLYFALTATRPVHDDQMIYDKLGASLLENHEFSTRKGRPTAYGTPGYPFFLSLVYFFFGRSYLWVRIFQALLGTLVCWLTYLIARHTLGETVALWTLFFMSIHHFFIVYGTLLLSENLFIFLIALDILLLIKFLKSPSYLYAALFGWVASLTTFTRSAYFLFPFTAIIFLFLMSKMINIAYARLLKFSLAMIFCFIVPLSAWTLRNYVIFKSFIPLSTQPGVVFYSAYNPLRGKILDSCAQDAATWKYAELSEVEGNRFLLKQTALSIKNDPSNIYKYIPLRLMYFFSVFDWVAFDSHGTYNFSWAFILPLSFVGIILAWRRKYAYSILLLLSPLIYFLFITVTIMGVPRTRLPVEPYLIIYAAFFLNDIYSRSRSKLKIVGAACLWYLLNYALYLNSPSIKIISRGIFQKLGLW